MGKTKWLIVLVVALLAMPAAASTSLGQWGDGLPSVWYDAGTGDFGFDYVDPSYDPFLDCRRIRVTVPKSPIIVLPPGWLWPNWPPGWDNPPAATDLGTAFQVDNSSLDSLNDSGGFSLGQVFQSGLSQDYLLNNLTFEFSETQGGQLQAGDLVYIPEPTGLSLLALGALAALKRRR